MTGPFAGLAAFQETDAGWFFDRDRDIDLGVAELRNRPLVAMVGPSGASKSSLFNSRESRRGGRATVEHESVAVDASVAAAQEARERVLGSGPIGRCGRRTAPPSAPSLSSTRLDRRRAGGRTPPARREFT